MFVSVIPFIAGDSATQPPPQPPMNFGDSLLNHQIPAFFDSPAQFRAWLTKHHASATELLVGFRPKATGRGITYPEALDEALAYGWIDGVRRASPGGLHDPSPRAVPAAFGAR